MPEIIRFLEFKTDNEALAEVRDMVTTSLFTGLAFTDIQSLKKDEILNYLGEQEWIFTQRNKTGTNVRIPLVEIPRMIIEKYSALNRGTVFRRISNFHANKYLKLILAATGINKDFTFHMARHTFATSVTLSQGVPIETVSRMLGHTNIYTTQIYAKITNDKICRDMADLTERLGNKYQIAGDRPESDSRNIKTTPKRPNAML